MFYGWNFDWDYGTALLLFTDPPGGYASVSMVDIAYLGIEGKSEKDLQNLPYEERQLLLGAPSLPFDGMNERGLAIGMAAVPPGQMLPMRVKLQASYCGVVGFPRASYTPC